MPPDDIPICQLCGSDAGQAVYGPDRIIRITSVRVEIANMNGEPEENDMDVCQFCLAELTKHNVEGLALAPV